MVGETVRDGWGDGEGWVWVGRGMDRGRWSDAKTLADSCLVQLIGLLNVTEKTLEFGCSLLEVCRIGQMSAMKCSQCGPLASLE